MEWTVVEGCLRGWWNGLQWRALGEAGGMDSSGVAKIGMVDLAAFGTVLNQHNYFQCSII